MAAFIRNIRHLFKHVDLGNSDPDTKALVGALVNLIEDPDQEVRIMFGQNIKNLLEFWNGNGFLKEVQKIKVQIILTCCNHYVILLVLSDVFIQSD